MSSTLTVFEKGDRVAHPKRPEWGTGTVKDVQKIMHEGRSAQRLTIDFANKGKAVLNSAMAPLERRGIARVAAAPQSGNYNGSASKLWAGHPDQHTDDADRTRPADDRDAADRDNWLDELEGKTARSREELWQLNDAMTDAFRSPEDRLKAILDSYRYSTDPKSILVWATAQTGHDDPLSHYTRTDLEQAFPRFARERDQQLRTLVRDFKRKGQLRQVRKCMRGILPAAQSALDKAIRA